MTMLGEAVLLVQLYVVLAAGIALGVIIGWGLGRWRLLSGADPALDQRLCRRLTCGNAARADTGLCHYHTATMPPRRGRLGIVPPAEIVPNRRKGAA
jgi:hypothetical protein